jgi:hypothetical protein
MLYPLSYGRVTCSFPGFPGQKAKVEDTCNAALPRIEADAEAPDVEAPGEGGLARRFGGDGGCR